MAAWEEAAYLQGQDICSTDAMVNKDKINMDDSLKKEDESPTIPVLMQEEVDTDEHTAPFVFQNFNDVADLSAESFVRFLFVFSQVLKLV